MERELMDKEKLLRDREAELSQLGGDLNWHVNVMIVRIVKKSRRELLHMEIVVGTFDPNVASSTLSHTGEMVNSIDSFSTCDYDSLMNLGSMDVSGLHLLCANNDNEGVGPRNNAKITSLDRIAGYNHLNRDEEWLDYLLQYRVEFLNHATPFGKGNNPFNQDGAGLGFMLLCRTGCLNHETLFGKGYSPLNQDKNDMEELIRLYPLGKNSQQQPPRLRFFLEPLEKGPAMSIPYWWNDQGMKILISGVDVKPMHNTLPVWALAPLCAPASPSCASFMMPLPSSFVTQ
ncbi:unnamed protein product [Lactuca saligna]|uniref:Uncharacterized protein n=1 Tax=Lactuca saligna TaxID=75948 RepID=A0AA35YSD3_LACSI|nr:unnamed protein product [Lactuca saligna]